MKRTILAAALMLTAITATSSQAADDWIRIGHTDGGYSYDARPSSAYIKDTVAMVLVRTNRPDGTATFAYKVVRLRDCETGMGKVGTYNVSAVFQYENDFVLKGGTMASTFADILCTFAGRTGTQESGGAAAY